MILSSQYFIGLMSGTSMDGVDAVLVDLEGAPLKLLATHHVAMPEHLRESLLRLINNQSPHPLQCLGELDQLLGDLYAECVLDLLAKTSIGADSVRAIGCHGQTIYHSPEGATPFTMQIGDANRITQRTHITTVTDFRRRDMAAGGQGAPLVPAFHADLFQQEERDIAVVNIGGMANVTLLPGDSDRAVTGFDTGPGNVLLDGWIQKQQEKRFDEDGRFAQAGTVDEKLLQTLLADPYFSQSPPKSTGREYFNLEWLEQRLNGDTTPESVQATLVELTSQSIGDAIYRYLPACEELIVCGGGAFNPVLMQSLKQNLPRLTITASSDVGLDPQWVEATAFAWLAQQTLDGEPGNLPAVTGASEPVILGAIYPGRERHY